MACGSAIENNYVNLGVLIIQKQDLSHLICVAWRGLISIIIVIILYNTYTNNLQAYQSVPKT